MKATIYKKLVNVGQSKGVIISPDIIQALNIKLGDMLSITIETIKKKEE